MWSQIHRSVGPTLSAASKQSVCSISVTPKYTSSGQVATARAAATSSWFDKVSSRALFAPSKSAAVAAKYTSSGREAAIAARAARSSVLSSGFDEVPLLASLGPSKSAAGGLSEPAAVAPSAASSHGRVSSLAWFASSESGNAYWARISDGLALPAAELGCEVTPKYTSSGQVATARAAATSSWFDKVSSRALFAPSKSAAGGLSASLASFDPSKSRNAYMPWISGLLVLPATAFMLQEQEGYAAELERTFIAIKPDGVLQGELISEIVSQFEQKGFKLVAIKTVNPSKDFAAKHYHDLKERPFFNGLCDLLSSGPVIAMVWEGEGVIKYGHKLIGATGPKKSEPGTVRGDLAVVVGRNIIHGSDGPETAKDEINLWFKPEELVTYTSNAEKWVYGRGANEPSSSQAWQKFRLRARLICPITELKLELEVDRA